MAAGRPKKSQQTKTLTRTDRADRPGSALQGIEVSELPKAPTSLQTHGKKVWERTVKYYTEMGVFNPLDLAALEGHCQEIDLYQNALSHIKREIKECNAHNKKVNAALLQYEEEVKEAKENQQDKPTRPSDTYYKNPMVRMFANGPGQFYEKINPAVEAYKLFRKMASESGKALALDPKSRSQINFPKPKALDGFDAYLELQNLIDYEETVDNYCNQVLQGVDELGRDFQRGKMEKAAVRRYLKDIERQGSKEFPYVFDKKRANYMLNFAKFLQFVEGSVAGQKVRYEPWQAFIHWNEYGWIQQESKNRRFTTSFVAVARKNNKTTLNSVQQNFHLYADYDDFEKKRLVQGGQVFTGASSLVQANICFKHARKMVLESTILNDRSTVLKESIYVEETNSVMRALHSDSERLDGFNPSFATIDEVHANKNSGVYDKVRTGQAARKQPFIKGITTAGEDLASFGAQLWDTGRKILQEEIENEDYFIQIFEPDDPDGWQDPVEWRKANPNWGESINPEMFEKQFSEALTMPSKKLKFKQLNLNIWCHGGEDWLSLEQWKACGAELNWPDLQDNYCYLGFDLAERQDICAVYVIVKGIEGGLKIKPLFFIPANVVDKKTKEEGVPYREWVNNGHLLPCGGDTINFDSMIETVLSTLSEHDITISHAEFDKYQAMQLLNYLQDDLGISASHTPQTFNHYNEPTRRIEADVIEKRLLHDNNPVMNWMITNVNIIMQSHTEYVKPVKKDQTSKVDGVHALLTGLAGMKKAEDMPNDENDFSITTVEL